VALYLQVADYLRGRIETGKLSPGDQLPPEPELAQSFHVSRHTIREALRYLKARGYIESRQGKGSVVRDRRRSLRVNPVIGSINDLLQFASETVLKPVSVASEPASSEVAELLNLEPGDDVLRISVLRCDESDVVFGYTNVYIPTIFAEDLSPETIHNMPIYAHIERNTGIEVVGVEQRITAVGASESLVKHLGLKRGEPVLKITRLYYKEGGRPVEFAESFHHSSVYEYLIHLRKEI
jgi:GntR family transcriptional regulator